jgi:hypothetical protein
VNILPWQQASNCFVSLLLDCRFVPHSPIDLTPHPRSRSSKLTQWQKRIFRPRDFPRSPDNARLLQVLLLSLRYMYEGNMHSRVAYFRMDPGKRLYSVSRIVKGQGSGAGFSRMSRRNLTASWCRED